MAIFDPMTRWDILEIALRGGAAALCVVIAMQLLSVRPVRKVAWIGLLMMGSAALYAFNTLPQAEALFGPAFIWTRALSFMAPAFFWLFVSYLVDDSFCLSRYSIAAMVAYGALFFPVCLVISDISPFAKIAHLVASGLYVAAALYTTWRSRGDDLVESRRSVASTLLAVVPFTGVVIMALSLVEVLEVSNAFVSHFQAVALFVTSVCFAASISGIRSHLLPSAKPKLRLDEPALDAADRMELARLRTLMENGAFLQSGLTIGGLADRMNVPEHRLRRLINRNMGYRNFAEFINDHRIDEAKRRLADTSLAREQITGIAYDLGFASLAPFNRAFRERTGMSPSEFRQKALNAAV